MIEACMSRPRHQEWIGGVRWHSIARLSCRRVRAVRHAAPRGDIAFTREPTQLPTPHFLRWKSHTLEGVWRTSTSLFPPARRLGLANSHRASGIPGCQYTSDAYQHTLATFAPEHRAKMTRLLGEITDFCQIETMPRMEGNVLVALLAPKKGVPVAKPATPQAAQQAS